MLEIFGTIVGLLYLWLEYKAHAGLWIAGMVMPAIYLQIYYEAGLYADFAINVYYLLIAVYGWLYWKFGPFFSRDHRPLQEDLPITFMPFRYWLPLSGIVIVLFVAMSLFLEHFTDSTVPFLDSFTTALSIAGMWMLARKYLEQWIVWILVDLVSAGLYVHKQLYFTAALYLLYAIVAILGYRKWKRMMPAQTISKP